MIINLYAGPCSGKTTTAHALYAALKLKNIKVGIAHETAFDMIMSGRTHMLKDQVWMFAEQNRRINALLADGYTVITDCPLLMSLVYCDPNMTGYDNFVNLVKDYYRSNINLNIFIERPDVFQQWGRVHNLEQSIEVDKKVKEVLQENSCRPYFVKANKNTVNNIVKIVEKALKPKKASKSTGWKGPR